MYCTELQPTFACGPRLENKEMLSRLFVLAKVHMYKNLDLLQFTKKCCLNRVFLKSKYDIVLKHH